MAKTLKKKYEHNGLAPCDPNCKHSECEFSCFGYNLYKTCQRCFRLFVIGNLRDAALKACDMPDRHLRQEFFEMFERRYGKQTGIRQLAFRMFEKRKANIGEAAHRKRLREYAVQHDAMTRLGADLKTPAEHISELRAVISEEVA